MTIESKKISKEYIEEFLNTGISIAKIKADPKRKIENWFSKIMRWLIFVCVWMVVVLCLMVFYVFWMLNNGLSATFCIMGAVLLVMIGMIIIIFSKNFKLLKMLKAKRKEYMTEKRNVVYTISEEGVEYEDIGKQKIFFVWSEVDFILIRTYGSYIIPKNTSKMAFIGIPNDNEKTLKDHLTDQNIKVKIIEE